MIGPSAVAVAKPTCRCSRDRSLVWIVETASHQSRFEIKAMSNGAFGSLIMCEDQSRYRIVRSQFEEQPEHRRSV